MWPGPYGDWGSRKYLLASLDQSLAAHGPRLRRHLLLAPLRPRHAARGDDGRAGHRGPLRAGRCTPGSRRTTPARTRAGRRHPPRPRHAAADLTSRPTRCSTAGSRTTACSTRSTRSAQGASRSRRWPRACSPTATCTGVPADSRVATGGAIEPRHAHRGSAGPRPGAGRRSRAGRGQCLAQLALAWALRDPRMTSARDRREQRRPARGQRRRARPDSTSPTTSWPRSTATPPMLGSISGPGPAPPEHHGEPAPQRRRRRGRRTSRPERPGQAQRHDVVPRCLTVEERLRQSTRQIPRRRGGVVREVFAEAPTQPVHPMIDRVVAPLDQPVGVHHQCRPRFHREPHVGSQAPRNPEEG